MFKRVISSLLCVIICVSAVCSGVIGLTASADECEHKFSDWSLITYPTCTENGVEYKLCETCGLVEITLPAIAHTFTDGECETCGAMLGDINLDKNLDILDMILLKETLLNLPETYNNLYDINSDGAINADDITVLRQMLFED